MKFAVNSGLLDANPASTIGEVFEKPKTQHMPSIPPARLPELMLRFENTNLEPAPVAMPQVHRHH
ncbi:hypothetical protein AIT98_000568 [Salmonella enterica subsp. indica]|uniref:hypothetical protein n=1 Tax=Salmonella enterica TaxID=28901 RepID=UPI0020CA558E|nr:hypothetical protein [Salmonella enterica]